MTRIVSLFLMSMAVLSAGPMFPQDYSKERNAVAQALKSQQPAEALKLLEPLLKEHPADPVLWTLRGLAMNQDGHTDESLNGFDRALSLDSHFLPALEGASQTAYLHGDKRASQYIDRLLVLQPANTVANAMAAALAYQAKDCDKSILLFERSGDEVYKSVTAVSEFADCLVQKDRLDEAGTALENESKLHPDSVQIKYNLALVLSRKNDQAGTISILEPLAGEKDSQLLNLLASAYARANRPDDAFHALETAVALDPKQESNYLDMAILCLEHNRESRSIAAATAGIARIPNAASLYLIRGVAYAQIAQYEEAEKDFATAAKINPDQPHSTIALSLLYSDRNETDKEKALLQQQLKITPNDAVANYLYADILIREGAEPGQPRFEEARAHLQRSVAAQPKSAEAQVLMGSVYQQENQLPEALEHYDLALRAEPENRSALDHKLLVLRKLHRDQEALDIVKQLRSILNDQLKHETPPGQVRVSQ
jgi:tetratricopeptide (TPR) repeat protein